MYHLASEAPAMAEVLNEFRVSNDAMDDAAELRRRIADEGYLFFRKLQDPDQLRQLRLDMLGVIRDGGWLQEGTDLIDGVADISRRCTEGDPEYPKVYHEMYKLQSFHRAGHWPVVLDMMEKIIGEPVMPQPQKIARLWFPQHTDHTTPPHQDFVHFQGTYEAYTCWTPVGDCPRELGGLAIVPGSHKANTVFDHHFSLGAGALTVDADRGKGEWLTTDYEIGDSLIFHSLTLHRALDNVTADRLRVSLDNRYQAVSSPIAEHMLEPHMALLSPITWEEVYADWESDELQFYWRDLPTKVVPRDTSYAERGFAEALSLAREGDPRAQLRMRRVIVNDPDSKMGTAAAEALREFEARADSPAPQPSAVQQGR